MNVTHVVSSLSDILVIRESFINTSGNNRLNSVNQLRKYLNEKEKKSFKGNVGLNHVFDPNTVTLDGLFFLGSFRYTFNLFHMRTELIFFRRSVPGSISSGAFAVK